MCVWGEILDLYLFFLSCFCVDVVMLFVIMYVYMYVLSDIDFSRDGRFLVACISTTTSNTTSFSTSTSSSSSSSILVFKLSTYLSSSTSSFSSYQDCCMSVVCELSLPHTLAVRFTSVGILTLSSPPLPLPLPLSLPRLSFPLSSSMDCGSSGEDGRNIELCLQV